MRIFSIFLLTATAAQPALAIPQNEPVAPPPPSQSVDNEQPSPLLSQNQEEADVEKPAITKPVVSRGERGSRWRDDTVVCKKVTKIGSRFKETRCHSVADWEILTKETREGLSIFLR